MKQRCSWLITLALSILLVLTLAACTGGEGGSETQAPTGSSSDDITPTEPTTTPESAPALDTDASAETTDPVEETTAPPTPTDDLLAQFAVLSDIHIGKSNVNPKPETKFESALKQISALMPDCQAVAVAGDMTDLGTDAQYQTLMNIWNQNKPANAAFAPCLGNHEFFRDGVVRFGGESEAFLKECRDAYQKYLGDLYTDTVVGGVHIIAVSADNSAAQYDNAEAFLIEHVKAAAKEDPNMPIIVIAHQGLGTYYNDGSGVFSSKTVSELQKYPQIIVFSGHTHYSAYDPRMIQQNRFTTVQTGTVGADYWSYTYIDPDQPPRKDETSEGYLVRVTKAGVVTITRYDFFRQCEIAEPWVIDIPAVSASGKAFTYKDNRKNDATAPTFPANATVKASDITANAATIGWPVPTLTSDAQDGAVIHYTVQAVEKKSGAVFGKTTLLSEYFLGSQAASECTHALTGLLPDSTYEVTVIAETSWGKTATLTGTFQTLPDDSDADDSDAKVLFFADYTSGSYEDKSDSALTCEIFGAPKIEDGIALLDKQSAYAYHMTEDIYKQIPANLSLEADIYIDPDQTYPWGYVTLIGNTEAGGFCLSYNNAGMLQFEINIGGTYKTLQTKPKTGQWIHVLATYDGQTQNIYIDGILAASAACSGNIKHVAPISRKLVVGADVNQDGNIQCIANIQVRFVRLYDKGLSAKTAFELGNKE